MSQAETGHIGMQPFFGERDQLTDNSFCKLKAMTVKHCNNLPTIFPFYMCGRYSSLEYLSLIDCGSLQEIYELQGINYEETHATTVNHLRNLHIKCLPKLKYVWNKDPQGILSFQNLHTVRVSTCQSLKNLFPASIARSLLQLEELDIYNCGMEEIVSEEGEAKAAARFVFPRMTSLRPFKIAELRNFYLGIHISEWPMLKKLEVYHCDRVEILVSKHPSYQETTAEGQLDAPAHQPLFLVRKAAFQSLDNFSLG